MFTYILLALFVLLQAADGWSTLAILNRGGYERNPILADLMNKIGILTAILIVKSAASVGATVMVLLLPDFTTTRVVLIILCLIYGVVLSNNRQVLKNLSRRANYDH